jgi:hypothetical protein
VHAIWSVLSPSTVAVLDRRFAAEAARYPELISTLFDRLSERSLRLATSQAISQLTRVDRRLMALFWHLAERWGRASGDGVIVPLVLAPRPRAARRRRAGRRSRRPRPSSPAAESSCADRTGRGCCTATRPTPRRSPALPPRAAATRAGPIRPAGASPVNPAGSLPASRPRRSSLPRAALAPGRPRELMYHPPRKRATSSEARRASTP